MNLRFLLWPAVGLLCAGQLAGQPNPPGPPPPGPRAPRREAPGPWDHDVLLYRAGTNSQVDRLAAFERAGVPTLGRLKDGRLLAAFQYFPKDDQRAFDRVAVSFSSDEARTWSTPQAIAIEGLETGLARPFDPTLVPLPDGRVRLYFTSSRSPDFRRATPAIYSAVSSNGIDYTFETGVRFGLEGRIVIDCAAALHDGQFHLIVPDNGSAEEFQARVGHQAPPQDCMAYHAVSRDGLEFKRLPDLKLDLRGNWLGNMQSDGRVLTFFGTGEGKLWAATSSDGDKWELVKEFPRVPGADPGAVKLRDGHWLFAVTGPPRANTPSAVAGPRQPPRSEPR